MSISEGEARKLLEEQALRVTEPRLSVLHVLAESDAPLSYTEVLGRLGDTACCPTTIYRNLVKLRDAGLAHVVSRVEGVDRYALADGRDDGHRHPHFVCETCSRVACLPIELGSSIAMDGPWAASVEQAALQLRGQCPDCR